MEWRRPDSKAIDSDASFDSDALIDTYKDTAVVKASQIIHSIPSASVFFFIERVKSFFGVEEF